MDHGRLSVGQFVTSALESSRAFSIQSPCADESGRTTQVRDGEGCVGPALETHPSAHAADQRATDAHRGRASETREDSRDDPADSDSAAEGEVGRDSGGRSGLWSHGGWPDSGATSTCSVAPWRRPFRRIPYDILSDRRIGAASPSSSSSVIFRWGLILVTGPTGSGKSTTLAAHGEEDHIARRPVHHADASRIPIEFLFA